MLSNYHFRYGRSSLYKLPLAVNPTGCARSEPRMKAHFKKLVRLSAIMTNEKALNTVVDCHQKVNSVACHRDFSTC